METIKKLFLHSPIRYVISIVLAITIIVIVILTREKNELINYVDGTFIAASLLIGLGVLSILNFFGAFDTFSYSFYYIGSHFSKKEKKYEDIVDYREKKIESRKHRNYTFMPYLSLGLILLIISFILLFIHNA